jgi:hypothetical protein
MLVAAVVGHLTQLQVAAQEVLAVEEVAGLLITVLE